MLRRILLPVILALLAWGFWISPDFREISAGVAIFLFGMLMLEEGFRAFTGGVLEKVLKHSTSGLFRSIGFGVVTTTLMQSSSLVSVITISFLSAGLIDLAAGIGIAFGANIGTTTGAWLVAGLGLKVKISAWAMPMLVFGVILVFQRSRALKGLGYILAGIGFLFLGIHYMKEGFEAFRDTVDLSAYAMEGYAGLFVYAAIGLVATVIMQSSHATLVLIITALASGQISYENGLALAIGANIGTTITAIVGALGANHQGKRLAAAHLIFNMVTGLIAIAFINQLVWSVDHIAAEAGIAADDYTLKLAIFHTIFNVIGVLVMTPFRGRLVVMLERAIPAPQQDRAAPIYLNAAVRDFPETLVEAVRNESLHLYENAYQVMAHGLGLHRRQIEAEADLVDLLADNRQMIDIDLDARYMGQVKMLYSAITAWTSKTQKDVDRVSAEELFALRRACGNIVQAVKDVKHLHKNMSRFVRDENPHIRAEYNRLRIDLGNLLRAMHEIRQADSGDMLALLDLDDFKINMEQDNAAANGNIDRLIREEHISPDMATSLMNDIDYARNLVWNLCDAALVIFGAHDADHHAAELLVSLDQGEVESLREEQL